MSDIKAKLVSTINSKSGDITIPTNTKLVKSTTKDGSETLSSTVDRIDYKSSRKKGNIAGKIRSFGYMVEDENLLPCDGGIYRKSDYPELSGIVEDSLHKSLSDLSSQFISSGTNSISDDYGQIAQFEDKIIITGSSRSYFLSTDNGTTWTRHTTTFSSNFFGSIDVNSNGFVMCMNSGILQEFYSSSDGINWKTTTTAGNVRTVTCVNDKIVVGMTGTTISTSDDLETWSSISLGEVWAPSCLFHVTYVDNTYIGCGWGNAIWVSKDGGITWPIAYTPTTNSYSSFLSIVYGNGTCVAVSEDGTGVYSTDLETWTPVNIGAEYLSHIVFFNGKFIAIGKTYNAVYTSIDGKVWSSLEMDSGISHITTDDDYVYIVGENSLFKKSSDGITWTNAFYNDIETSFVQVFSNNDVIIVYSVTEIYRIAKEDIETILVPYIPSDEGMYNFIQAKTEKDKFDVSLVYNDDIVE